jgi:hypothetical protein
MWALLGRKICRIFILLFYDPWWVSWGKRRAGILKNETHILLFKTVPLQTKSYGEE